MASEDYRRKFAALIFIILCIIVYILEGILINPFAFWNMVPLVFAYLILGAGYEHESYAIKFGSIGFMIGSVVVAFLAHFAWFYDWGNTKTGSSTSG